MVKAIEAAARVSGKKVQQDIISIGDEEKTISYDKINIILLKKSPSSGNMSNIPLNFRQFINFYDIFHLNQYVTKFGIYCALLLASASKKFIGTDHGGGHEDLMTKFGGINFADEIVSVSKFAADLLKNNYRIKNNVIIGPVDDEYLNQILQKCPKKIME